MKTSSPRRFLTTFFGLGLVAATTAFSSAACVGTSDLSDGDSVSENDQGLDGSDAVSRAMQWVDAKLPYCEGVNGGYDQDSSCHAHEHNGICSRPKNASWDAYRSDCSGLVSWAWGLPAPGRVTWEFAPAPGGLGHVISLHDLSPGDALSHPHEHIILFKSWVSSTQAVLIEEPGCNPDLAYHYAHEFTATLSIGSDGDVHVSGSSRGYTPIRISGSGGGGDEGCSPGGLYCGGDKVEGDKDTLYKCTGGTKGDVVKQCHYGCRVNPGDDDNCKAKPGGGGGTGGNGGGTPGTGSTGGGTPGSGSTGTGTPGAGSTGSGNPTGGGGNGCVVGGLYCGGDKVDGDRSSLYQCTGGSSGNLVQACANGCHINDGGQDDACRPGVEQGSGGCVHGGKYCGGDKVTGAKNILYRCDHGDKGDEIRQCPHGCNVNPGQDDSCQ